MTYEQAIADATRAMRNAFPTRWEEIMSKITSPAPLRPRVALGVLAERAPTQTSVFTIYPSSSDDVSARATIPSSYPDPVLVEIIIQKGDASRLFGYFDISRPWDYFPIYPGEIIRIHTNSLQLFNHGEEGVEIRVVRFGGTPSRGY